jgi:glycosyltransferase involved in cell wall biosynthesis
MQLHRHPQRKEICQGLYFLFVNPHIHHSYFSVLALSQVLPVVVICPPLQLQLFMRKWEMNGLRIKRSSLAETIAQMLSFVCFLLYKIRALPEEGYISVLSFVCSSLLAFRKCYIFYHYQDYIKVNPSLRTGLFFDICEMIISINKSTSNQADSLKACKLADIVVCPSTALSQGLVTLSKNIYIAPYGGDKSGYLCGIPRNEKVLIDCALPTNRLRYLITARANSQRKGLDILLSSLCILNDHFAAHPHLLSDSTIDLRICGSIAPGADYLKYHATLEKLSVSKKIILSAKQYTQAECINLVASSDFFIMPSRLEGSSPAALEALWLGVPCILSRECGIDSFVSTRHGVQLESLTSICLSKAICHFILEPSTLTKMRHNLELDRALFSWRQYLDAYKNLLLDNIVSCQ